MRPFIHSTCYAIIFSALCLVQLCTAQIDMATRKQIDSLRKIGKWEELKTMIEQNYDKADNDQLRLSLNFVLSGACTELKDPAGAAAALYRMIAINPKIGTVWGNLGWDLYLLNKLDSAQIATEKAIALDSTLSYAIGNLGLIQLRKGKDVALKTYKRAADLLFEKGDMATFDGIYGDLISEKDKLQKNKKLYEQVVAYLDGMKDLIKQKSELQEK